MISDWNTVSSTYLTLAVIYLFVWIILYLQTAVISYDYITTFRNVSYGTEEYWDLKSKVRAIITVETL